MADAARVWASCFRSRREAQVGEREGPANGGRGKRVGKLFSVARGKRRSEGVGLQMGGRGKCAGKPFSVARRKRRSEGVGLQMGGQGKSAGKAVFGRVREAQVGGREGPANGGRGKGTDEPFAVASGKRNGHWDRWEDWVGECGQGHAGRSGQALAGSGLCGGRGWGKNAWAGALRLRDRKNRAREGCPPAVPHI